MIKDFENIFSHKLFQQYSIGRIFPLFFIYYSMKFLNIALTDQNIVLQFQILNSILIILSVILWVKIASLLNLSRLSGWIGFVALFINFATLKNTAYYPVSLDPFTFFFGLLLLLFFLKKNSIGILILSVLGAFVSPTMILFGLILFFFKSQEIKKQAAKYKLNHILSLAICLGILGGIIYTVYFSGFLLQVEAVEPITSLIPISIVSLVIFLYVLFSQLFNNNGLFNFLKIIKSVSVLKLIIAVAAFYLVQVIFQNIGRPNTEQYQTSVYLKTIFKLSVAKPFIGIISFVIWFGPAIFLVFMNWKKIIEEIYKYGYGLVIFFAGFLLLFLDVESRHVILIYPFLCAFTLKIMDRQPMNKFFITGFVVLSVIFSKIWFLINPIPEDNGNLWEFPMQKYFMNVGPWISNQAYAIQGIFVLFSFIILFYFYRISNLNKLTGNLST